MLTQKPRFPIKSIIGHGWLPSPLKKIYYRLKGYKIGKGVKLGVGSVIEGKNVSIGDDVDLGFLAIVRGKKLHLGNRVRIGAMAIIDTPRLEIGDDTKFNEQVYVGGLQNADSSLVVGRNSQIQQWTFINPFKPITIGNDTSIGGHSLIFSHQSWLNIFDGYMADFRPIHIGNDVGVAWRVFVGAGAKIGDGAMIGTNSLVNRSIPTKCLAMGTPAKVVAKPPYFPRTPSQDEKVSMFEGIRNDLRDFLTGHEIDCSLEGKVLEVTLKNGRSQALFIDAPEELDTASIKTQVVASLTSISTEQRQQLDEKDIIWFDLERKERSSKTSDLSEEISMFLRRYGVRFVRD